MRKILFGILLSVLTMFSSFADDITCGVGTEPYTELEYIESTGTQYIDTGIVPMADIAIDMDLKFERGTFTGMAATLLGAYELDSTIMFAINFGANTNLSHTMFFWAHPYLDDSTNVRSLTGIPDNILFNRNNLYMDGTTVRYGSLSRDVSPRGPAGITNTLVVFGNHGTSGNVTPFGAYPGMYVYRFKIYDNGTLVRDFVPARRNSDGAVGMYDRVDGKFYGNDGTGDFVAGPDVGLLLGGCNVCATDYYNDTGNNTSCVQCPAGYSAAGDNASDHDNINDCKITCGGGFYLSSQYGTECTQTGVGYWSPSHTYGYGDMGIRNQCPEGLTTIGFGLGADEVGDCGMKFHVGGDALYLRSERKTTPTLNVEYGGRVFYGNMDSYTTPMSVDTTRKLHIEYNNIVYSVHDDSTKLYDFDSNGRLVGASDNIYINLSGRQFIDTDFVPNQDTQIITKVQFNSIEDNNALAFGAGQSYNQSTFECYVWKSKIQFHYYNREIFGAVLKVGDIVDIDFNKNIINYSVNGVKQQTINMGYGKFTTPHTLYLGIIHRVSSSASTFINMHRTQIYDNGTLIRDFVPVPAGMVINGYVVPSNGMWDIVEQKFYGNSGTGEFIYGVD